MANPVIFFFFQAEDGIRDVAVTGVQTCALPILIGSPPGYLGHRETHPLLSQEALNQLHTENVKLGFVLFDEIEKASDALWNLLLGILDKATLTLGDNRKVDFSAAMIFL